MTTRIQVYRLLFFTVEFINNADIETKYTDLLTVANPNKLSVNKRFCENGITGIRMTDSEMSLDDIKYKEITIATNSKEVVTQEYWHRGMWQDPLVMYCNELLSDNDFKERTLLFLMTQLQKVN